MLQTTKFNQANVCALYNKGVNARAVALDTLTSRDEKKMENYLVVPNICILSLQVRPNHPPFFLHAYARAKRRMPPVDKGLLEVSSVIFSYPYLEKIRRVYERDNNYSVSKSN